HRHARRSFLLAHRAGLGKGPRRAGASRPLAHLLEDGFIALTPCRALREPLLRCRLFWCGEFPLYCWLLPLAIEPGNECPGEHRQQENPEGRAEEHAQHHETHASVHHPVDHRVHHWYLTPFLYLFISSLR